MATNLPATIENVPSHIAKYRRENFNERFKSETGTPMGRLSLDRKQFTFVMKNAEPWTVMNTAGEPTTFLDVVLVDANPKDSRTYYAKGMQPGTVERPDCTSTNGDVPDAGVPHPQHATCKGCPWDTWGTGVDAQGNATKGKRCSTAKRLALLPLFDLANADWNGPIMLRVPTTSLGNLTKYQAELEREGRDINLIVTRIRYDPAQRQQVLQFLPGRWLEEDECELVNIWYGTDHLQRLISGSFETDAEDGAADPEPEPEVAPPPSTARERVAAAAAAAKSKAAGAAAPKPTAKPVAEAEPEVVAAPAKKTAPVAGRKPVVTPAATVAAKPVAAPATKPVAKPAPAPVAAKPAAKPVVAKPTPKLAVVAPEPQEDPHDVLAQKQADLEELITTLESAKEGSALYNTLMSQAETLQEEVAQMAADLGVDLGDGSGEVIEGESEVVENGDEATTEELLAALQSEDLSGVPD